MIYVLKVVYAYDIEFHIFKSREEALTYFDGMSKDKRNKTFYFESDKSLDLLSDIYEVVYH